jgi:hypothetical protein
MPRNRKGWRWGHHNRRTLYFEALRGEVELTYITQTGSRYYLRLPRDVWVALLQHAIPVTRAIPSSIDSLEQLAEEDLIRYQQKKRRQRHSDKVLRRR